MSWWHELDTKHTKQECSQSYQLNSISYIWSNIFVCKLSFTPNQSRRYLSYEHLSYEHLSYLSYEHLSYLSYEQYSSIRSAEPQRNFKIIVLFLCEELTLLIETKLFDQAPYPLSHTQSSISPGQGNWRVILAQTATGTGNNKCWRLYHTRIPGYVINHNI